MSRLNYTYKTTKRRKKKKRSRVLIFVLLLVMAVVFYHGVMNTQKTPPVDNYGAPLQIAYNRTELSRTKEDIQYIVIHDTANKRFGADARNHYNFFNSGNQESSADFFVDDGEILQVNDYYKYYTWHCGDGQGQHGITNQNSIGIEICVNRGGIYQHAVENTTALVKRLMEELDIDADHVVRHYDASYKCCPASMSKSDWKKWDKFIEEIK